MKLVVFGATGGTGRCILDLALAAGHDVLALARKPEAITLRDHLAVEKGDVLDAGDVASAVQGADAVLSAFGPANNKQPGTLMSQGVANIVAGCTQHGVKRFVFESGLMCSDGSELGLFSRLGVKLVGGIYSALRDDKRNAEQTIIASALDYVIVRPPVLSNDPARGDYKHGAGIAINAAAKLPHADVADFMVKCVSDPAVARTVQNIGR
ncbi:MAG TPA: NAD(P)H-binding protein [Kofleriaceae bacterium]|nr:NAD(P)H-binding protein [Kofleriaceae bacterium]